MEDQTQDQNNMTDPNAAPAGDDTEEMKKQEEETPAADSASSDNMGMGA